MSLGYAQLLCDFVLLSGGGTTGGGGGWTEIGLYNKHTQALFLSYVCG